MKNLDHIKMQMEDKMTDVKADLSEALEWVQEQKNNAYNLGIVNIPVFDTIIATLEQKAYQENQKMRHKMKNLDHIKRKMRQKSRLVITTYFDEMHDTIAGLESDVKIRDEKIEELEQHLKNVIADFITHTQWNGEPLPTIKNALNFLSGTSPDELLKISEYERMQKAMED